MRPISISLFFPTFNEEQNITSVVERTVAVAENCPYIGSYEILIIDDGSTDGTPHIADRLAAHFDTVRSIHHPANMGYGAALKTGFREARMEYVFFTDADMQFDLLEIEHLLIHIPKYRVVVGYRAPRRDPFMRLLNAAGWNVLNRLFFGLRVRDIDCAFKIFERSVLASVPIISEGAMINAELLVRLRREGIEIKEVPVSHLPRIHGSPTGARLSVIFRALRELLTLYAEELKTRAPSKDISRSRARNV